MTVGLLPRPRSTVSALALIRALELKDIHTGGHAERVAWMGMRLAERTHAGSLPPNEVLKDAFLLHDIGKIGIPDAILCKPDRLSRHEQRVMETHPLLGVKIVEPMDVSKLALDVIRSHHERWDGAGYPDRLAGDEIPLAARVLAIVDAIDAMVSPRPYRRTVSIREALIEVLAKAGTQFDPDLARLAWTTFNSD